MFKLLDRVIIFIIFFLMFFIISFFKFFNKKDENESIDANELKKLF